jgi:hypothetical protein
MASQGEAWVWSAYRGVVGDEAAAEKAAPLPLFGATAESPTAKRLSWGAAFALAMGLGLFFPKIAFLLLIIAALMIASGLAPERFEDVCNGLPGGGFVLKTLAVIDALLP